MKPIETKSYSKLLALRREREALENRLQEIKGEMEALPGEMIAEGSCVPYVVSPEWENRVSRFLYWYADEIPAKFIRGRMDHKRWSEIISGGGLVSCHECGGDIEFRSRSHAKELLDNKVNICEACMTKKRESENEKWRTRIKEIEARQIELATMPYADYLKTPEWQERRATHLKRAHFKCQVCNSGGVLDVHHRTYERRGQENYNDLIVLCRSCHGKFHEVK